jgi:hypothetical protein
VASHTIAAVNDQWADGVVVSCFLRDAHGNATGAAVDTDTVAGGSVTFTGLAAATNYVASQGGKSRQFRTRGSADVGVVVLSQAEYDAIGSPDDGTLYVIVG